MFIKGSEKEIKNKGVLCIFIEGVFRKDNPYFAMMP